MYYLEFKKSYSLDSSYIPLSCVPHFKCSKLIASIPIVLT